MTTVAPTATAALSAEPLAREVDEAFRAAFGRPPEVLTRAPGRLEMLGNHTDYNEGTVLSVAVDRATCIAAARAVDGGRHCRVRDVRTASARVFSLDELDRPVPGDWANYIKGLVVELHKRGIDVPAFDAVLASSVPMAAGMSSSAALEMAAAFALGHLAEVTLPWLEWARIGQACENLYVGAQTGLMDQFSSLMGRRGQLVFSDFRSLEVRNVPLPAGTALVVANSMVRHNLTGEYNERRAACERAVAVLAARDPDVRTLRDVSLAALDAARADLDATSFRRALHVVGEMARVQQGVTALTAGDVDAFGALMFASHESSRGNFENSTPELDLLVEIGRDLPGAFGARLSGGGFGGITVHLVADEQAADYAHGLAAAYERGTGIRPETMICHVADGAQVLCANTTCG